MRMSTRTMTRVTIRVLQGCAVLPAAAASGAVAVVAFGLLPPAGEVAAWAVAVVVCAILASRRLEAVGAYLLAGARPPHGEEQRLLAPVAELAARSGLPTGRVLVRRHDRTGVVAIAARWVAEAVGRETVVVEPRLLEALASQRVSTAQAAAGLGQAAAWRRVAPARIDLVLRLWMLPWSLVTALCRRVARGFSWLPAGRLVWRLRFVPTVIALVQGLHAQHAERSGTSQVVGSVGPAQAGILAAVLVGLTYLVPAADRWWHSLAEREADAVVAATGLGTALVTLLAPIAGARRRVERLRRMVGAHSGSSSGGSQEAHAGRAGAAPDAEPGAERVAGGR